MSSLDIIVAVPSGAGWVPVHAMAELLARYTGGTVHTVDVGASLSKETKLLARLPRLKGGSRRCVVIASDPGQLYAIAQRSFAFRRYGAIYGWVIDSFWDDRIPAIAKSSAYDRIFVADADDRGRREDPRCASLGCGRVELLLGAPGSSAVEEHRFVACGSSARRLRG